MKLKKVILASVLSTACLLALQGCWITEHGEKIGTIVKLNKQGLIFKTNEAELIRGGMNSGSGAFGQVFDFTIEDEDKLSTINQALEKQYLVKIKYHKEFATLWRTETHDNSFLDAVEIVKENK